MRKVLRTTMTLAAALLALATALPAAAQFAKPEDAIKYRKAVFTVMASHFGRVAAMANGKAPFDAKVAADSAEIALSMSKLPYVAFLPGTDKGETRAKPEIWTDWDKVKGLAEKMQEEMVKFNMAAKTGNIDTIKAAAGETGKACKACHDNYRKE
ncbi:MAG: cytochrome c [Burkholderiaceae bacterium]